MRNLTEEHQTNPEDPSMVALRFQETASEFRLAYLSSGDRLFLEMARLYIDRARKVRLGLVSRSENS